MNNWNYIKKGANGWEVLNLFATPDDNMVRTVLMFLQMWHLLCMYNNYSCFAMYLQVSQDVPP